MSPKPAYTYHPLPHSPNSSSDLSTSSTSSSNPRRSSLTPLMTLSVLRYRRSYYALTGLFVLAAVGVLWGQVGDKGLGLGVFQSGDLQEVGEVVIVAPDDMFGVDEGEEEGVWREARVGDWSAERLDIGNMTWPDLSEAEEGVTKYLDVRTKYNKAVEEGFTIAEEARSNYVLLMEKQGEEGNIPVPALRPVMALPGHCLEQWFINGTLCANPTSNSTAEHQPSNKDDPSFAVSITDTDHPTHPPVPEPQLDIIFTWVNGSDPLWSLRRNEVASRQGDGQSSKYNPTTPGTVHHWRANKIIRYGLRSVVRAFDVASEKGRLNAGGIKEVDGEDERVVEGPLGRGRRSAVRKMHVISADMGLEGVGYLKKMERVEEGEEGGRVKVAQDLVGGESSWRLGQVPDWLEQKEILLGDGSTGFKALTDDSGVDLQWHFHSEAAHLPIAMPAGVKQTKGYLPRWDREAKLQAREEGEAGSEFPWKDEEEWKGMVLPTYNSFVIESMIGWMKGVGDISVQLNDDMVILTSLSTSDFFSLPYGSVFRLDNSRNLRVKPEINPTKISDPGEWGALGHTSTLLSTRFARMPRQYINHMPKTITLPIMHEAMHMFGRELARASTRPFRESMIGNGDVEMAFLGTHLRIERWREGLLWSWVVGKVGLMEGLEKGVWGGKAREELGRILNVTRLGEVDEAEIIPGKRQTLGQINSVFSGLGHSAPLSTEYSFSSMDGHLPSLDRRPNGACTIKLETCFGKEWLRGKGEWKAEEVFKRVAFDHAECGDCLITALVIKSGPLGLSEFLPAENTVIPSAAVDPEIAYLPLTSNWQTTDFSLKSVLNYGKPQTTINLRSWTIKLLSRYLYVTGNTPAEFTPLTTAYQARTFVSKLEARPKTAFACINDDARPDHEQAIDEVIDEWLEKRLGGSRGYWEKEGV